MTSLSEPGSDFESPALELASCQASLAFERTLITLDQTLMGAVRTSLALISFGFAMVLFFHEFGGNAGIDLRSPARVLGICLLVLGTALVAFALLGHRKRFNVLKLKMDELYCRKLLAERCPYEHSATAVFALVLLLTGLVATAAVVARIAPIF